MQWSKLYNPLVLGLLRSPLHRMGSGMFMVVTFIGRKSGKTYSTPVEYFYDADDVLFFTQQDRVWWRNLQDGAHITVRIQGQDRAGTSQTSSGDRAVFAPALDAYLRKFPGRARYFGVREEDGVLNRDDITAAAEKHVTVRITLE
jgi:hypothetical protein